MLAFEPSAFNLCVEDILFVCLLQFKNILVQHHEIGIFPDLDGTAFLLEAKACCTVYSEAFECLPDKGLSGPPDFWQPANRPLPIIVHATAMSSKVFLTVFIPLYINSYKDTAFFG